MPLSRQNLACHGSGLVIDQARKDGFRFGNQEEMDSGTSTEEKTRESNENEGSVKNA